MPVPERVELYRILPLDTPLSLHVFPIHRCNFRCTYCLHSLPGETLQSMGFKKEILPFSVFQRAIDDMRTFSKPLKSLIFAGHGEPLLHPDIARMVAYAKEKQVAERVEIVTNGSLLTNDLSDDLISAGLDRLRISVQGVNADIYHMVAGVKIDLNQYISNIRYFYENKNNTDVYIKIIDMALKSDEDEKRFYQLFKSVSDTAAIEYTIPFVNEIDLSEKTPLKRAKQGHMPQEVQICPMPFYQMVLLPSGNITGCCAVKPPVVYGSVENASLKDMWENNIRSDFIFTQLTNRWKNSVCRECSVPMYGLQTGDYLDPYKQLLLERYSQGT